MQNPYMKHNEAPVHVHVPHVDDPKGIIADVEVAKEYHSGWIALISCCTIPEGKMFNPYTRYAVALLSGDDGDVIEKTNWIIGKSKAIDRFDSFCHAFNV